MVHIHIETEDLPAGYRWDPQCPVRGTEEFYVETARHLASFGHRVTVAYDGPRAAVGAARFVPRRVIDRAPILLDCNARVPFYRRGFRAGRRVAWTNFANVTAGQYAAYDALVCVSETHRAMLGGGIVVPHGVDRTKYVPAEKRRVAIYTSSMDRGGWLLRSHRDDIERRTGALLRFSRYPAAGSTHRPLAEQEMIVLFGEATWWLHPGLGVELFCLGAAKAQAAGCIPIVRPKMALDETVRCGYKINTNEEAAFVQAVVDAMNGVSGNPNVVYLGMPDSPSSHIPSWEQATIRLAAVLTG